MVEPISAKVASYAGGLTFLFGAGYLHAKYLKKIKVKQAGETIIFKCNGSPPFSVGLSTILQTSAEDLADRMLKAISIHKPNSPPPPYSKFYLAAMRARAIALKVKEQSAVVDFARKAA